MDKSENSLHLTIRNKDLVLFDGNVVSFTSFNESGKFDVLPDHANFISLITTRVIVRMTQGKVFEVPFDNALLRVLSGKCDIYIGIKNL